MTKLILFLCLSFSVLTVAQAQRDGEAMTVLYIHGEFSDKPMGLADKKWFAQSETLHATLQDYWAEHSYGKIPKLSATYTPVLKLPGKSADYFDYNALATGMKKAAAEAGFDRKKFDHLVFYYPSIKHNISFGGLGGGGQIWLPGQHPFDGGLIHEFGHALGLGHTNSIEGEGKVVYPGARREGRDGLHMLGSDSNQRVGSYSTINLPMRYHLKFVGDEHIITAKKSGIYRIHEFELTYLPYSGAKVGLKFKVKGEEFWVSFGPKMAKRWSNFNSRGFEKGIIVHRSQGSVTDLLDFTPGSLGKGNEADYVDCRDGALVIGKSYTFPGSEISIAPVSHGVDTEGVRYLDVRLSFEKGDEELEKRTLGQAQGTVEEAEDVTILKAKSESLKANRENAVFYSKPAAAAEDVMSATIQSFLGADSQSRIGVMYRSGSADNAPHASVFIAGDGAVTMLWREKSGASNQGEKIEIDPTSLKTLVLRVRKDEFSFTGEYSLDAEKWLPIKTVTLPKKSNYLKGLAVSSGDREREVSATFAAVNWGR